MEFVERVKRFEAKQFTGGRKGYLEMVEWLKNAGIAHVSWVPETSSEPCTGRTDERLVIAWSGKVWSLPVGKWIVFEKRNFDMGIGGPFETFFNEDFEALYRPAKNSD